MGANLIEIFQGGYCLAVSVAIVLEKCALFTQIMGLVALHGHRDIWATNTLQ